ncbi:hypothetical protein SAE01_40270 [Segetibacter aerophilus]|uniref:Uncharacterized protein n=1 Tax=Segetibacter aerophilus TaxID=670293 RepID=A0A512BHV1_9BACT|nr:hypothetical protein SAE01_40270 [Segetibacter aerophilus]
MDRNNYRVGLDKTSKKFPCPQCGQRRFVKYIDTETQEFLSDEVGRCDRENNCGYHLTPKEYFNDTENIGSIPEALQPKTIQQETRQVEYLPLEMVELSMEQNNKTSFAAYIKSLFHTEICDKLLSNYIVGNSFKPEESPACIFWRIDKDGNIRTGKVMHYDKVSGKRDKQMVPT